MKLLIIGICGFVGSIVACALQDERRAGEPLTIFGGGPANTFSLLQLSRWCADRFGECKIEADPAPRPFDIPWMVMDSSHAKLFWDWRPQTNLADIFDKVARHAQGRKDWLDVSVDF